MAVGTFLDTVGVEFEGTGKTQDSIRRLLNMSPMTTDGKVEHDASVEIKVKTTSSGGMLNVNNPEISDLTVFGGGQTYGYEICTPPLSVDDAIRFSWEVLPRLREYGDFVSSRASIHVHVGYAANLKMLKNTLMLGIKLDPLLFAIGTMGYRTHRGALNDFAYCRPLELGAVIKYGRKRYKVLNIDAAMSATDQGSFWWAYGVNVQNVIRYHPSRYFAWNLMSLLLHGTLEFRYFNQSHSPGVVSAVIDICHAIAELSAFISTPDIVNIQKVEFIGVVPEISDLHCLLDHLIYLIKTYNIDIKGSSLDIIRGIMRPVSIPDEWVLTHLREFEPSDRTVDDLVEVPKCKVPGYVDIHNLSTISLLEE